MEQQQEDVRQVLTMARVFIDKAKDQDNGTYDEEYTMAHAWGRADAYMDEAKIMIDTALKMIEGK